jgi:hypothetical protein
VSLSPNAPSRPASHDPGNHNEVLRCYPCSRCRRVRCAPGDHHLCTVCSQALRAYSSSQLRIGLHSRRCDVPSRLPWKRPSQCLANRRHQQMRCRVRSGFWLEARFRCIRRVPTILHCQLLSQQPDCLCPWRRSGSFGQRWCSTHHWLCPPVCFSW